MIVLNDDGSVSDLGLTEEVQQRLSNLQRVFVLLWNLKDEQKTRSSWNGLSERYGNLRVQCRARGEMGTKEIIEEQMVLDRDIERRGLGSANSDLCLYLRPGLPQGDPRPALRLDCSGLCRSLGALAPWCHEHLLANNSLYRDGYKEEQ